MMMMMPEMWVVVLRAVVDPCLDFFGVLRWLEL